MRACFMAVCAVTLALTACSDIAPTDVERVAVVPAFAKTLGPGSATSLSGAEEVPAVDTRARGAASFKVSADGESLTYRLIVANIEGVTQAHIHVGSAGENGPVVVFLFGLVVGGTGSVNGVLAQGTVSASDLTGPLTGQPLSALIDAMVAGNAYVNVHTLAHPPGEIRGQI